MSASVAIARPPPPPAQFRGMARQFRDTIDAEDQAIGRALFDALAPLQARMRSKKSRTFRQDSLTACAYHWRRAPNAATRLRFDVELGKGRLRLRETRVCAGRFRFADWPDEQHTEIDVGLVEIDLCARPTHLHCTTALVASISFHGLGRWFERSADKSHDALRADLLLLAKACPTIIGTRGEFTVACASGRWVGRTIQTTHNGKETRSVSVRSFLN